MASTETFGFIAEWYDPQPMITRQYLIKVFAENEAIEIVDLKTRKCFLKRSPIPKPLTVSDFFVGSKVLIYARLMKIVDFGDGYTRRHFASSNQTAALVVSPDCYHNVGQILGDCLNNGDWKVTKLQSVGLTESEAVELITLLRSPAPEEQQLKFWTSGACVAVELRGADAHERMENLVSGLRSRYAANDLEAGVWYAPMLSDFFFGGTRVFRTTATMTNCTCGVIRPHAVKSGDFAAIIDAVLQGGFMITALQMFELSDVSAKEFLELYEDVLPNYNSLVQQMCTGPCIAMEIMSRTATDDVVGAFRSFAGPWDVEMARELEPKTIRAKFGVDSDRNALHCTDLPDDGENECSYFFDLLQGS